MEEKLIELESGKRDFLINRSYRIFINEEIATETGCHNEVDGIKIHFEHGCIY